MSGTTPSNQPAGDRWCPVHGVGPCACTPYFTPQPPYDPCPLPSPYIAPQPFPDFAVPLPLVPLRRPTFTPYDPDIVRRIDELEKQNRDLKTRVARLERKRKR